MTLIGGMVLTGVLLARGGAGATGPDTWAPTFELATGRSNAAASMLGGTATGKVLLTGGKTSAVSSALSSTEIYDPLSNAWSAGPNLLHPRANHQSVAMGDAEGRVMVGCDDNVATPYVPEIYSPLTNSWAAVPAMLTPRGKCSLTRLANGKILLVGGASSSVNVFTSEIYDPTALINAWQAAASVPIAAVNAPAVHLADDSVLVIGTSTIQYRYTPASNTWTATGTSAAFVNPTATLLADGNVLVFDGNKAQVYNQALNTWSAAHELPAPRYRANAVLLSNQRTLVAGGTDALSQPQASAYLYDAALNAWSTVASMNEARSGATLTMLSGGNALAAAGAYANTAEVYQPGVPPLPDVPSLTPTLTGTPPPSATPTSIVPTIVPPSLTPIPPTLTVVPTVVPTLTAVPTVELPTVTFTAVPTIEVPTLTPIPTIVPPTIELPTVTITPVPTVAVPTVVPPTIELPTLTITPLPTIVIPTVVLPTVTLSPLPTIILPTIPPLPATTTATVTPIVLPLDLDGDGVLDLQDNCPLIANPGQENADGNFVDLSPFGRAYNDITVVNSDNLGDACDPDADNDGFLNNVELDLGPGGQFNSMCSSTTGATDPLKLDTDGDGVTDRAECVLGTDPVNPASVPPFSPAGDTDRDGLSDAFELTIGTNPLIPDTDGDRLLDGVEYKFYGSDPLNPNTDADVCSDGREAASMNDDLKVNSTDLLIVAQFASSLHGAQYVPDFDVNKDRRINSTDLLIVAKLQGTC